MKFVFFFSLAVLISFASGAEPSLLPEDQALIHELCQMSEQGNVCLQRQKAEAVERVVGMITQTVPEEERAVSFAAMLRVEGPLLAAREKVKKVLALVLWVCYYMPRFQRL